MKLFRKKPNRPYVSAVLAAGGSSTRFGEENKLLIPLDSIPVLAHSMLALEACPTVDEIIVVCHEGIFLAVSQMVADFHVSKVTKVVRGGSTRQESVLRGLREISSHSKYAVVHDGARPLVTPELITEVCNKAFLCSCATAASLVTDTIKRVKDGAIVETLNREALVAAQTPQVTDVQLLTAALTQAIRQEINVTDDCMAIELFGVKPVPVITNVPNLKITVPFDLLLAQALLDGGR